MRNTDHLTARSLRLQQLISWGRSHFLTRCWTLSSGGKPTDFEPGGKLSSTNVSVFWEPFRFRIRLTFQSSQVRDNRSTYMVNKVNNSMLVFK